MRNLTLLLLVIAQQCVTCSTTSAQDQWKNPPNTQKEAIPFTPPEKALEMMEVPKGFEVTLFAHEPDVHQPIAMTFDSKGRLWVVENYTYSDNKENFNNDLHDRVVIFEDVDNDGKFDNRTIFWDKGNKLTGIELGRGGVWLTAAPEFIFIPDANQDDVPDGPPKVILDGFEDKVIRHNLVNGLRWGPDGWLYSRHGIQAVSHVGKPGSPMSKRTPMNCCVWRYHPQRDVFEIVAEGGTNFWGLDFDEHGELFVINTVIGHLFHIVPGARYNRMYGSHFNPYTWETIDQTADHFHWGSNENWWDAKKGPVSDVGRGSDATDKAGGGHAHSGFMIYQGDNWPEKYRGNAFTLNFHGRRINQDVLVREGNSYIGKHEKDMFQTADPWFRGVELAYGPDGAVYVLDWSDIGECHENDGIHRTSGRIFKISWGTPELTMLVGAGQDFFKNSRLDKVKDLNSLSDHQLATLMSNGNAWYSRMALRILQDRSASNMKLDATAKSHLTAWFRAADADPELKALWVLNSFKSLDEDVVNAFYNAKDEQLRAALVRVISDREVSSPLHKELLEKLASDSSPLVRLHVASAIKRLDSATAFSVAKTLVSYKLDMSDRVQPKLIWHQIEPFLIDNFDQAIDLFSVAKSQMLRTNIIRRLACDPDQQNEMLEQIVAKLQQGKLPYELDAFRGIAKALEGRTRVKSPNGWDQLATMKRSESNPSDELISLIEEIEPVFGDLQSVERLMKLASDRDADVAARNNAIESLAQFADPAKLFPLLKSQMRDRLVSASVVKAMARCSEDEVAVLILNEFARLSDDGKRNAIETLCVRKSWALRLLEALKHGTVSTASITAWHARQIQLFEDELLTRKLTEVWGKVRDTSTERLAQMDELREMMTADRVESANRDSGKKLFVQHCASCHALFGEGGNIGPDITGSDRKNLNYLLENIIDPSATVATNYRTSVLAMDDGRLLSGVVLDNNGQTLKLQTQEELLTLEVDSVEDIRQTELSLMPENLLDKLSDEEKTDLFGYLMTK